MLFIIVRRSFPMKKIFFLNLVHNCFFFEVRRFNLFCFLLLGTLSTESSPVVVFLKLYLFYQYGIKDKNTTSSITLFHKFVVKFAVLQRDVVKLGICQFKLASCRFLNKLLLQVIFSHQLEQLSTTQIPFDYVHVAYFCEISLFI